MAAPLIGQFSDQRGPGRAVLIGILATVCGYVVLLLFGRTMIGLVLGIVAIDVGVQSGHVANQSRIYSLVPSARSRLNTFYMVTFFAGGALGSYCGPLGWKLWGWTGFCAFPLAAVGFALGYFFRVRDDRAVAAVRPA
jgi:predicted MFS family arabinose efflux permease